MERHAAPNSNRSNARRIPPLARAIGALVAVLAGLAGCGPDRGTAGDAKKFLVYDRESSGDYVLRERTIQTLNDLPTVDGDYAYLRAGGVVATPNSNPQTAEELKNSTKIKDDKEPEADYEIRSDGLVVPWDFHSTMMFTVYHHLEAARDYFEAHGVEASTIRRIPVYYNTSIQALLPIEQLTNNAAYMFTLDAFLIPPSLLKKSVPLGANRGVMVHEFSHLIFNRLVNDDARAPEYLLRWGQAGNNRIKSINEGVADIFAALQTDDANFIDASLSKEQFNVDRDLSEERHYDQDLYDCVNKNYPDDDHEKERIRQTCEIGSSDTAWRYNPYKLGSVIAATAWAVKSNTDVTIEELSTAVLETLRYMSGVGESSFTTLRFFEDLHDNLPADDRREACGILYNRLDAIQGQLTCDR